MKIIRSKEEHDAYVHICGRSGEEIDKTDGKPCKTCERSVECDRDHVALYPDFYEMIDLIVEKTKDRFKKAVHDWLLLNIIYGHRTGVEKPLSTEFDPRYFSISYTHITDMFSFVMIESDLKDENISALVEAANDVGLNIAMSMGIGLIELYYPEDRHKVHRETRYIREDNFEDVMFR